MTAARTDAAPGASCASCPRPPALKAPDLRRPRDGGADELAAGEMVEDLQLAGADLSGVDAQRVRFEESRVGTLRLCDGSLADVDLRGLEMKVVSGVGSLGGATVSGQQLAELAPLMAAHLGLRVDG